MVGSVTATGAPSPAMPVFAVVWLYSTAAWLPVAHTEAAMATANHLPDTLMTLPRCGLGDAFRPNIHPNANSSKSNARGSRHWAAWRAPATPVRPISCFL